MEVLLPPKIAKTLKVGELVTFTTSADTNSMGLQGSRGLTLVMLYPDIPQVISSKE
ncbi:hypothetical protein [Myxosarcina sp. GI1]|uniref:hypothetical protein n=1 Tax=Myxosarcina sp. GI1 TaxID=1541065 RepID=UPI0012DFEA8B|nr:hypothetical protein [Myxosarcina sp. GI1]